MHSQQKFEHSQRYHKGRKPFATLVGAGPCCRCTPSTTEGVNVRPVNPCDHPGKHPCTPNGVKDATNDRTIIKEWWRRWPDANIGIATGRTSGIFVLDVDGNAGKESLTELQAEHGRLPKTVTVQTGKGRHRYFRCDGARVGNSAGRLGKGIDVRGDGGYVVAAGSVHVSGALYRFVDGRGFGRDRRSAGAEVAARPGYSQKEPQATRPIEIFTIPPAKLDRAHAYGELARRRELDRLAKAPNTSETTP